MKAGRALWVAAILVGGAAGPASVWLATEVGWWSEAVMSVGWAVLGWWGAPRTRVWLGGRNRE